MIKYIKNNGYGEKCILEIQGTTAELTVLTTKEAQNIEEPWYDTVHDAITDLYKGNVHTAIRYLHFTL